MEDTTMPKLTLTPDLAPAPETPVPAKAEAPPPPGTGALEASASRNAPQLCSAVFIRNPSFMIRIGGLRPPICRFNGLRILPFSSTSTFPVADTLGGPGMDSPRENLPWGLHIILSARAK